MTVTANVHCAAYQENLDTIKAETLGNEETIFLRVSTANLILDIEAAHRIINALRPFVPDNYGITPERLESSDAEPQGDLL